MDDALVLYQRSCIAPHWGVLILVVMDDALVLSI